MSESELLTGEPLVLDLVNTRPVEGGCRKDLLATPEQLAAWLALQAHRLPEGLAEGMSDESDLAPVRAVRQDAETALRALLDGDAPPRAALRRLTEAQRAAPPVRALHWDGAAVTADERREGPLGVRIAALLAEAAADLLTDPVALGRLKQCEADACVMLFLPAHPRRRWCSPTRCGNRARVARYYERHRAEG
ncbi:CGNR zinc finger domain-containing protein [Streptomyces violascens]|uniref:CGNR zinc finger domain-containing protein n=1 Tax=Streptomyces violascens TaxID=67381 RepID=UPI00367DE91E